MDRGGNPAGPAEGGAIKSTKEWKEQEGGGRVGMLLVIFPKVFAHLL